MDNRTSRRIARKRKKTFLIFLVVLLLGITSSGFIPSTVHIVYAKKADTEDTDSSNSDDDSSDEDDEDSDTDDEDDDKDNEDEDEDEDDEDNSGVTQTPRQQTTAPKQVTEDEIDGIKKKIDWGVDHYDLPDDSNLSKDEKQAVQNWGKDISNNKSNKAIQTARSFIMIIGILVILYSIFIYIVYWVDRNNVFFDISLLSIITKGKLEVAPDEHSSNFSFKHTKEVKFVNHRNILTIAVIGILVGFIILSGTLYMVVAKIIAIITKLREFIFKAKRYLTLIRVRYLFLTKEDTMNI